MATVMNESLGSLEYDNLINSAAPADIVHAALATGYGTLKRGALIAKASNGGLIPFGSDITTPLTQELTPTAHVATHSQAGLRTDTLKVYAAEYFSAAAEVADHAVSVEVAGLDEETLVVKDGATTLTVTTDYTVTYDDGVLAIALVAGDHYAAEELTFWCEYEDETFALLASADYEASYATPLLTVTLDEESAYYDTPTVKVVCNYTYSETSIAQANLVLAKDIDTGLSAGSTVTAEAYRSGRFSENKLIIDDKAVDGVSATAKEALRSVGILIDDAMSLT